MNAENNEWPFDQPRNCATMTLRQVMDRSKPILLVSHDEDDHGWQFLDGDPIKMKDAMLVCLEEVVKIDPTVMEVADIPPGWQAVRKSANASWQRRLNPREV
jgi:hypothetical protein